jgi:hypothetical protein
VGSSPDRCGAASRSAVPNLPPTHLPDRRAGPSKRVRPCQRRVSAEMAVFASRIGLPSDHGWSSPRRAHRRLIEVLEGPSDPANEPVIDEVMASSRISDIDRWPNGHALPAQADIPDGPVKRLQVEGHSVVRTARAVEDGPFWSFRPHQYDRAAFDMLGHISNAIDDQHVAKMGSRKPSSGPARQATDHPHRILPRKGSWSPTPH